MKNNLIYRESPYKRKNGLFGWKYLYDNEKRKSIYNQDNITREIILYI